MEAPMSEVRDQMDVNAPIERVWETVMDPDRFSEWVTIHRSLANVSGDRSAPGATMDQELSMRGVTVKVHWELEEVDPPRLAVWRGRGPAGSEAVTRYELSGGTDGAPTHFDYLNDFSTPGGRLGAMAGRLVVGSASQKEAAQSLARLKALLEG